MQRKARIARVSRGALRARRVRLLPDAGSGGGLVGELSGPRC